MDDKLTILLTDRVAYVARYERSDRRWSRSALYEYGVEAPHSPDDAESLVPVAENLGQQLRSDYPDGAVCQLIVPSNWCCPHLVDNLADRGGDQAVVFEYEQYVPFELEDVTCVRQALAGDASLVMGVPTEAMRRFLNTLDDHCFPAEVVTVDVAPFLPNTAWPETASGTNTILLDDRRLIVLTPGAGTQVADQIRIIYLGQDSDPLVPHHLATCLALAPPGNDQWRLLELGEGADTQAVESAIESTGGTVIRCPRETAPGLLLDAMQQADGLVDLRQNELSYSGRWKSVTRRLVNCAVATAVLFGVLAVRMRVDIVSHAHAMNELRELRADIYRQAFPDQPIPPGASLRLQSERIKLEGLTETATGRGNSIDLNGLAAFELLQQAVARIPSGLKLHVTEIGVNHSALRISGQTTSHSAAGELVQQLNQIPMLAVDPPRTKLRKDRTVEFKIHARRLTDEQRP